MAPALENMINLVLHCRWKILMRHCQLTQMSDVARAHLAHVRCSYCCPHHRLSSSSSSSSVVFLLLLITILLPLLSFLPLLLLLPSQRARKGVPDIRCRVFLNTGSWKSRPFPQERFFVLSRFLTVPGPVEGPRRPKTAKNLRRDFFATSEIWVACRRERTVPWRALGRGAPPPGAPRPARGDRGSRGGGSGGQVDGNGGWPKRGGKKGPKGAF